MTAGSSSSSKAPAGPPPIARAAAEPAATGDPPSPKGRPLIEVRDLGVWYRLHKKKRSTVKRGLLSFRFGAEHEVLWALRHISFECFEGEALGIVGPNGAGKSTLCLTLARILMPDEGVARIRGQVSTLLTLGAGFNRDLSGLANIQLYAAFLGISRKELDRKMNDKFSQARETLSKLGDAYHQAYYDGIIAERRAKVALGQNAPSSGYVAHGWFVDAMELFEKAIEPRPAGNDDPILRWNTCARIMNRNPAVKPAPLDSVPDMLE